MDYSTSIYNLGIKGDVNAKTVKMAYHKGCLKYHPDRTMRDTREEFNTIRVSYEYLMNHIENDTTSSKVENCSDKKQMYYTIIDKMIDIISNMNIENYDILETFGLPECVINKIKKNATMMEYNINPTIDNLLNDDIYRLPIDGSVYIIPMWWGSTIIETNTGKSVNINMLYELPHNVKIDDENNVIVSLNRSIKSLMSKDVISFHIGSIEFVIKIKILKYQTITLSHRGLLDQSADDIVDDMNRKDIIVYLTLG